MSSILPTKRRRGGQPGNKNAKGNRGNAHPRPNFGNKGGRAPQDNVNACKARTDRYLIILEEYRHDPEASAWIHAHMDDLREAAFTSDFERDRALYQGALGMTPEALVEHGLEYRLGAYSVPNPNLEDPMS